jgi:glycosyltransferase involved in cell wall biosynthesis
VRVLVFHGYLLHGTGSNVYNARLGEALVRAGHEVHLVCQDRDPLSLPWVDAVGDWDSGSLSVTGSGPATVYRPDIGGILPVYVADVYEGIEARPFPELSDAEVEDYVSRNVEAVREVVERARPDVALANHLIMGPAVLARALGDSVPYAVKIHGSALEYTVKPYPRFLPWAREGLASARGVLVGSRHTGESLWAAMEGANNGSIEGGPEVAAGGEGGAAAEAGRPNLGSAQEIQPTRPDGSSFGAADEGVPPNDRYAYISQHTPPQDAPCGPPTTSEPASLGAPLKARTRLGPPGVDVTAFAPRSPDEARRGLQGLVARLRETPASGHGSFERDPREAAEALQDLEGRLVVFVGKLIASKGVELLLAAWPIVAAAHPDARLVIVGFGAWRDGLEELRGLLAAGDLAGARALRAEDGRELPELAAFLDRPLPQDYAAAALRDVRFTGRLEHDELADLLPAAEALVAPSTFPESFGMVAAEGAAAGALPVVARHSGLAEVSEALAEHVPDEARPALSFAVGPASVDELGSCLTTWLGVSADVRAATREAIVAVTRERWSWDGVARTVLAAAQGDLDGLPPVDPIGFRG